MDFNHKVQLIINFIPLNVVLATISWIECHASADDIDGLVQERCNSSALAMELHLSCTSSSIYRWLSARQQYLQYISNGDTAILH